MADEIQDLGMPYAVYEKNGSATRFNKLGTATNYAEHIGAKSVYLLSKTRNRTDSDEFTAWRTSIEVVADYINGAWEYY